MYTSHVPARAPRSLLVAQSAPVLPSRPRATLTLAQGTLAARHHFRATFSATSTGCRARHVARAGGADGPAGGNSGDMDPCPGQTSGNGQDAANPGSIKWNSEAALRTLGLGPGASFEQILAARNALQATNPAAGATYEMAYDHLLQRRLRQRISGELEVSLQVRYADATPRRPPWTLQQGSSGAPSVSGPSRTSSSSSSSSTSSQERAASSASRRVLGQGASTSTLTLAPPKQQLATQQVLVYAGLGAWAIFQALAESPQVQMMDVGGTQLSLAIAYAVYTLREHKNMNLGRAVGLALGATLLGAFVGSAVEGWVRVDLFPLGAFQSPGVLCSEFSMSALLMCALFLV